MILHVTSENNYGIVPGRVYMPAEEFSDIANHPYISTENFDTVVIDLCDKIPAGIISAMLGKYKLIPNIRGNLTSKMVGLLAEMYPDRAAELQYSFIHKDGKIITIINDLSNTFEWDSYK